MKVKCINTGGWKEWKPKTAQWWLYYSYPPGSIMPPGEYEKIKLFMAQHNITSYKSEHLGNTKKPTWFFEKESDIDNDF